MTRANVGPWVRTRSGVPVGWHAGVPPVEDFLWQLGRLPRFVGATNVFWSVLDHSYHVFRLAVKLAPEVRLLGLMHDFGELLTGDVPSPFKPWEWHVLERGFVERIGRAWGVELNASDEAWRLVKMLDAMALRVEGQTFTGGDWPLNDTDWTLACLPIQKLSRAPFWGPIHEDVKALLMPKGTA